MQIKTYQGATLAEALAAVKRDLGPQALVLRTRKLRRSGLLGLGGGEIVEVTAGLGVVPRKTVAAPEAADRAPGEYPVAGRNPTLFRPAPSTDALPGTARMEKSGSETFAAATPTAATSASATSSAASAAGVSTDADRKKVGVRSATGYAPGALSAPDARVWAAETLKQPGFELRAEVTALRTMVEQLLDRTAQLRQQRGELPPAVREAYAQLIAQGVADDLASRVTDDLATELSPEQLASPALLRERLLGKLASLFPLTPGDLPPPLLRAPRIICLIGPTGVGKTTTIAKLAANSKLRGGQKVGLVTIDTYRIAAVDQLRTYAGIIDVPLKVVTTPAEMAAGMQELAACDTVLIDTTGRSPQDELKLNELAGFVQAARPTEVHLVLAATCTPPAMLAAFEQFARVRVDRLIFSKLDEAATFGPLLNVARRCGRAISYLTTGQDVPDCLEPGDARRLAGLILGERV